MPSDASSDDDVEGVDEAVNTGIPSRSRVTVDEYPEYDRFDDR